MRSDSGDLATSFMSASAARAALLAGFSPVTGANAALRSHSSTSDAVPPCSVIFSIAALIGVPDWSDEMPRWGRNWRNSTATGAFSIGATSTCRDFQSAAAGRQASSESATWTSLSSARGGAALNGIPSLAS